MTYETIQLEMRDTVGVLTLNRPDRLNALNVQVAHDFKAAVKEALERGARAIVITGAGRAFSAGGDLREMQEIAKQQGRVEAFFEEQFSFTDPSYIQMELGAMGIAEAGDRAEDEPAAKDGPSGADGGG